MSETWEFPRAKRETSVMLAQSYPCNNVRTGPLLTSILIALEKLLQDKEEYKQGNILLGKVGNSARST